MGDGNYGKAIGIGIIIITFADLPTVFPLYPCYHMSGNPQDTFSPPACKHYILDTRSVRYEALEWSRLTTANNKSARITTIHKYRDMEIQDYMKINIMTTQHFSTDPTHNSYRIQKKLFFSTLHPNSIIPLLKNDDPDWTIIHRRLDYVKDNVLTEMYKHNTIDGLPQRFSTEFQ